MWRVLCVDDDPDLADQVAEYFTAWDNSPHGEFECVKENSFSKAISRLRNERFDLVTLDVHGDKDGNEEGDDQRGERVLESLRGTRFVPVIFVTGYAAKVSHLESVVIKVVTKGGVGEMDSVRAAASSIFATGMPEFAHWLEAIQRDYLWKTISDHWKELSVEATASDLPALVARRIASQIERGALQEDPAKARPIDYYIYPPLSNELHSGNLYKVDDDFFIVVTPACDLVVRKDGKRKCTDVILVQAEPISKNPLFVNWKMNQWVTGADGDGKGAHDKLVQIIKNNGPDHLHFLPGTFFVPALVGNFQVLKSIPAEELEKTAPLCAIDSPFREEFLLQFSRFYGRLGTPDLAALEIIESFVTRNVQTQQLI